MDAAARAAHPLAPIINAAFDRSLTYADLAAMLDPRPSPREKVVSPENPDRLWSDLTLVYELGIEQASDPDAGRKLMMDLALLQLEQLGDRRNGERQLRRVLASDPAHSAAVDAYVGLLLEEGRYEEAIDLLERATDAAADEAKPDLLIELASVANNHLRDPERAIEALRTAHEWDTSRIDVLARMRVILVEQERWIDVKNVLDEETAHVLAWGGDDDDAAMRSLAESYRLLGERAFSSGLANRLAEECFRRAVLLGDDEAQEKHQMVVQLGTRWSTVAAEYRHQGFDARDRRRAALFHLRAAGLELEYGSDFESASDGFDRSWLLDRGSREALELLERAYLAHKRPKELAARLGRIAASTPDRALKVELLLRAARIAPDPLPWYLRVLEVSPGHQEAIRRVDRIYAHRGLHAERAQLLEDALDDASPCREKQLWLALGRLYAEKLGNYDRACNHLERVLKIDPESFEAASVLRAIYKDRGDAPKLARVLDVLIAYCPDRKSRIELQKECGSASRERRSRKRWLRGEPSCTRSPSDDNLAADGRKRRAEEERSLS